MHVFTFVAILELYNFVSIALSMAKVYVSHSFSMCILHYKYGQAKLKIVFL